MTVFFRILIAALTALAIAATFAANVGGAHAGPFPSAIL